MSKPELIKVVPGVNNENIRLIETLWNSYKFEYAHNYASLEQETDLDKETLKRLLEPLKKLGHVYTAKGLMTEEGEVAGSGFIVNGQVAFFLLELAMYRYHYNDRPYGRSEDYVPTTLKVGEYTYILKKEAA